MAGLVSPNTEVLLLKGQDEPLEPIESWVSRFAFDVDFQNYTHVTTVFSSPQCFWNTETETWDRLLLTDNTDQVNPHFLLRNAHISARIGISSEWDLEGVLYYTPDMTERVCAEFWMVQGYIGDEWSSLDSVFHSYDLIYEQDSLINLTGYFRVYYGLVEVGRLAVSYILRPSAFLKHEITFINLTPQTQNVRLVMSLVGLAGKKVIHRLGETVVTLTEQQIESSFLKFVDVENPALVCFTENLESLGHWENLETEEPVWINDLVYAIRVKLIQYWGLELVRCDIVLGPFELASSEVVFIDPDSSSWQVDASADDCTCDVDDNYMQSLTNNWLGFPRDSDGSSERWSGVRFQDVTIPQGVTITDAYLYGRAYSDYSNTIYIRVYGEDEDDTSQFSTSANFQGRDRTTQYVDIEISDDWDNGDWYSLDGCGGIIQEIVNRGGWSSGNAMVLFIQNDGTTGTTRRNFRSYDYSGNSDGVELYVTWESNVAPTIDSVTVLNFDDTDNMYARLRWYYVEINVTDGDGYADLEYVYLAVYDGISDRLDIQYNEDDDSYEVVYSTGWWDFDEGESSYEKSGNILSVIFAIQPTFIRFAESNEMSLYVEAYDDETGESDFYYEYFDAVTNLLSSVECTDTDNPDRVDISTEITIDFSIRYADDPESSSVSIFYPPDSEFTSVSMYDSGNNNKGTDSSVVNGDGDVTFTSKASVGVETYNVFINMVDPLYLDGEESTIETVYTDTLIVVFFANDTDCSANQVTAIYWQLVRELDDSVVKDYELFISRNATHWSGLLTEDSLAVTDTLGSGRYVYTVNGTVLDNVYSLESYSAESLMVTWDRLGSVSAGVSLGVVSGWILILTLICLGMVGILWNKR